MPLLAPAFRNIVLQVVLCVAGVHLGSASHAQERSRTGDVAEATVRIEGLADGPLFANVRNTVPQPRLACDAPRPRFQSYLRNAADRARIALRALGYFNADIQTRIDDEEACQTPVLTIEAGPPVLIEDVDIVIDGPFEDDPSARRFFETLRLAVGDQLNQGAYDNARDELINRARARGHLDARYTRRTLWVDPEANVARIELTLESGPRYRFGEISAQQDILTPSLVARMISSKPGDPYSSDRLAAISGNLAASGYFADVRVRPDLDSRSDEEIPVTVLLTPRKRTAYEFRVGYGTDTGARTRADIERRWVNRRGHRWRGGVGLSQRIQSLETVYSIPRRNPLTDSLDFFARASHEDNNDVVSDTGAIGTQFTRVRNDWTQAAFSEYRYERTSFGSEAPRSSNFLLAGVRFGHRELDDPLFPTRGHSLNLALQGAAEPLLSSTSLVQASVRAALAWPLGNFILKGRGEIGSTWVEDFNRLPKSLRFFAGGDNSVRGYAFESLGPQNEAGDIVGGRQVLVLSAEAMVPVRGSDWFGAVFVDSGNAFDSFRSMNLHTGAGAGVRWRSPIGMVRVDIAMPLTGESRSPRLHLGIGAEF